jgi:hypothetical protein
MDLLERSRELAALEDALAAVRIPIADTVLVRPDPLPASV